MSLDSLLRLGFQRVATEFNTLRGQITTSLAGKVDTSDGRLTDARTPTAHKSTHATGGSDPLAPADIGAATSTHSHAESDITGLTTDLAGKQPLDSDLTAIAGLTPTNDDIIQRKSGSWINRTIAQLKADLSLTKADVGLGNVDNTSNATERAAVRTLTNARWTKRTVDITSTATLTHDADSYDQANITAQAAALSIANPTGTPTSGQQFMLRIKDNGTARAITWSGTQWRAIGVALPTTTVASKTMYIGAFWNATDSKWDVLSVGQEA